MAQLNIPADAEIIKYYKNGNVQIRRRVACDRCGNGKGTYYIGVRNGKLVPSYIDNGVCFKCGGSGWAYEKSVVKTPENEAKDEKKRQKRATLEAEQIAKREAELKEEEERRLAEAKAEEERIRAEKAISQYVGQIGDKIEVEVEYTGSAHFEVRSFSGFGTDLMYVHNFKDASGNKLVWKTGRGIGDVAETGDMVKVKGTIKDHTEYKEEKQTVLTRCRITA